MSLSVRSEDRHPFARSPRYDYGFHQGYQAARADLDDPLLEAKISSLNIRTCVYVLWTAVTVLHLVVLFWRWVARLFWAGSLVGTWLRWAAFLIRWSVRLAGWLEICVFGDKAFSAVPLELGHRLLDSAKDLLRWLRVFEGPEANLPEFVPNRHERLLVAETARGQVAPIGVTSGVAVLATIRLRRRARWVRALETALGGPAGCVADTLRGRWTPDLPAGVDRTDLRYVLATTQNGARVLGGGLITSYEQVELKDAPMHICRRAPREAGGERTPPTGFRDYAYYVVQRRDGTVQVVLPELLARLRQYSVFRPRTVELVGALRTRANEWGKARCLWAHHFEPFIADAVAQAMEESPHEELAKPRVDATIPPSASPPS